MRLVQAFLGFGVLIAHQGYFGRFVSMKIADNVRTPVSIANYTNADHTAPCGSSIPRHRRRARDACRGVEFRTLQLRGLLLDYFMLPEVKRGFETDVS